MKRSKFALAAAAGLLALTSVQVAQAQSQVDIERASAMLEESSGQLEGTTGEWIVGLVIVLAGAVGLYFLLEEDEEPVSP